MRVDVNITVIVSLVNKDITIAIINQLITAIKTNKIFLTIMPQNYSKVNNHSAFPPFFIEYIS